MTPSKHQSTTSTTLQEAQAAHPILSEVDRAFLTLFLIGPGSLTTIAAETGLDVAVCASVLTIAEKFLSPEIQAALANIEKAATQLSRVRALLGRPIAIDTLADVAAESNLNPNERRRAGSALLTRAQPRSAPVLGTPTLRGGFVQAKNQSRSPNHPSTQRQSIAQRPPRAPPLITAARPRHHLPGAQPNPPLHPARRPCRLHLSRPPVSHAPTPHPPLLRTPAPRRGVAPSSSAPLRPLRILRVPVFPRAIPSPPRPAWCQPDPLHPCPPAVPHAPLGSALVTDPDFIALESSAAPMSDRICFPANSILAHARYARARASCSVGPVAATLSTQPRRP